jgi:hypothetical protein
MARAMDHEGSPKGDDQLARWMSITEIASARQISRASAARMVRRKPWPKQKSNAGHVLYFVPIDDQQPKEGNHKGDPIGDDTVAALLASKDQTITALQGHVTDLREAIDRLQRELDGWRSVGLIRRLRRAWRSH